MYVLNDTHGGAEANANALQSLHLAVIFLLSDLKQMHDKRRHHENLLTDLFHVLLSIGFFKEAEIAFLKQIFENHVFFVTEKHVLWHHSVGAVEAFVQHLARNTEQHQWPVQKTLNSILRKKLCNSKLSAS